MANTTFRKTFQPSVHQGTLTFNTENKNDLKYTNRLNEKSLVTGAAIEAHPQCLVTIYTTRGNDLVTLIDQAILGSYPKSGPGQYHIDFGDGIVIGKDQSIVVGINQNFFDTNTLLAQVRFEKYKLMYNEE